VSVGLCVGGRFPAARLLPYIVAQVAGALVAGAVLALIANGKPGFDLVASGFAANGYGEHSPGGYSLASALVAEVVMTALFVVIILGSTASRAAASMAPVAIGLGLTLVHLISIPVTNTSVNPARSTGVAVFMGGWALQQLWLFWVAPIVGGVIGALWHRVTLEEESSRF
jgi:aquaporin Z